MIRILVAAWTAMAFASESLAWSTGEGCALIAWECMPVECCQAGAPAGVATLPEPLPTPPAPPSATDNATPAPPPNADAISPLPLNRPTMEAPSEVAPATVESAGTASPSAPPAASRYGDSPDEAAVATEAAPAVEAAAPPSSRYSLPPNEQTTAPAAEGPADLEDVFEEAPVEPAGAPPSVEQPTGAPTTEAPPVETPAEPSEAPTEAVPGEEDLFGPSSSLDTLRAPGGWESGRFRAWKRPDGEALAVGRLAGANGDSLKLATRGGALQELRYAELSAGDLNFLREQVQARREQLARREAHERLLASQR